MRTILTILLNDLRLFFGQRGNWVSVFLLPMAFTAVLGWAMGDVGDETTQAIVTVDVVDLDGTPASEHFLARMRTTNETLRLCPMDRNAGDGCDLDDEIAMRTVEAGIDRVQRGLTTALIVVPAGFGAAGQSSQTAQIDYYSLEDPTVPSPILQTVQTVVQEVNGAGVAEYVGMSLVDMLAGAAEGDGEGILATSNARKEFAAKLQENLATRIEAQPALVTFTATAPLADDTSLQGFEQAVPGMGTVFVMLTILGGMATLLNERKQWTLQRMAVAPVSRAQILGGKAGAYVVLGLVQFCVVFLVGVIVGISFGSAPLALLAIMVAFVLCITGLTFALAPHMKSEGQASGLARLLSLTLAPLGGAWWPLAIVPPFMQVIGHLSPVAWAMDAFQTIIWYNGALGDILLELGVLLVAAFVLFTIGVLSFRIDE